MERDLTFEQKLIAGIKQLVPNALIGDDCACLPAYTGNCILASTDTLVEGTHFNLEYTTAEQLGWKAAAVNLSDIAAMAGRPRHLLVSITLPENFPVPFFQEMYAALVSCAGLHGAEIAGGDLTRGEKLVVSITVLGQAHENGLLKRSGAMPGDLVAVTGDFAASRAGLYALVNGIAGFDQAKIAHLKPVPRLCQSWALVRKTGSRGALMDSSDGLADALLQIASASQCALEVDAEAIPVASETAALAEMAKTDVLQWALYGGEDFELVACMAADTFQAWQAAADKDDNPFQVIGRVLPGQGATVVYADGKRVELSMSGTFQHWQL